MNTERDPRPGDALSHIEEPVSVYPSSPQMRSMHVLGWARQNLFSSTSNTIMTLLCLGLLVQIVPGLLNWAFVNAIWSSATPDACKVSGAGACWAVIEQKHRFILFGLYPYEEHWRPITATVLFIIALAVTCNPRFWGPTLALVWVVTLPLCAILMWGGILGMTRVSNDRWGGLPLTLLLSVIGIGLAFPIGVLAALGRRSELPIIKSISVIYIELIRGVPLISVLFMASVMLPLFLPEGTTIDKLLRALVGITLFTGAYLAEAIRGGLQSLPRGQYEAADALGLGYWQKTRLIILPQAIRIVIPPLVNQFISMFKDTSLVIIIGLYDLLTTAKTAMTDPAWRPFYVEAYVFTALIYFAFSFFMSRYSLYLERHLNTGVRR
ncbi:amino acid ABC transporter permease [Haematospirillum jordaniae]|nr:amino acid ABC transporter permease [Haematospirillum jordaniae]NKD45718.1 amino acid ABC transporter permease [Haematospirillum jordaniae]NKD56746.1 amino acid ABC transporter permease [Haematospirillum jordaniae]NKD59098.1 amino acid ABC transporter permease [Haematospirillum jordaniae]NKD67859.1 amino acid ABC transporter permease [Haematospirillum jordaniae]NKD79100.1 amino acid ABC transporter permease [Haematospirillum jordaniae]